MADDFFFWRQFLFKRRKILLLVAVFMCIVYYNAIGYFIPATLDSFKLYERFEQETVDILQTCHIPLLHPFENEVLPYFKPSTPISCRSKIPMLTFLDAQGFLRYNTTAFVESGYSLDSLSCTYQEIWRGHEDSKVVFSDEKPVTGMDQPESDFIFVSCSRFTWLPATYSTYHAGVQRSPSVRTFRDDNEVGVTVIGIDSVSRLNFMRQLPRSYMALTETLGAVVFKGFNKVGLNTLPNIVPILTGNPPGETSAMHVTFDDWPFIWRQLNDDGVATMYGEDLSEISTFSWWGEGFKKDPTAHYFHRYWVAVDRSSLNAFSSPMCLGPLPKHRIYLDYLRSFLRTYSDSPTFMFSLENEPCHDYMNTVGVIDRDLEEFLLKGHEDGLFNRTILFVLADHGHRMDPFRKTPQGKLEDFMPMVSIVLPKWLASKHPDLINNLQTNAKRLTSSYDLYSTFTDIFQRRSFKDKPAVSYNFTKPQYGQSLFQPVPLERTCADAGIPELFCICKEDTETLPTDHPLVIKSTQIILNYTNTQILNGESTLWKTAHEEYRNFMVAKNKSFDNIDIEVTLKQCAKLELNKVEGAEVVLKPDGRKIVNLRYSTTPNDGLYEGLVEWGSSGEGKLNRDITRTNRYYKQADCLPKTLLIMVPFVRSACFCS